MKNHLYTTLTALLAILMLTSTPLLADKKVIAKVNGVAITEQDLKFAVLEMGPELQAMPAEQQRIILLEYLIQNHLLSKEGEKKKVGEQKNFEKRLKYYRMRATRDAYVEKYVRATVTEADARKIYDQAKANKQRRVKHILVKTEKEIKEIAEKIKKGEKFSDLAKKHSIGPRKAQGGDQGFIQKGRMIPALEKVVLSLKKDEVSKPIKTDFGWHLLTVTELRDPPLPPFDKVKTRIMSSLIQQKERTVLGDLRKAAKIEILDKSIEKNMKNMRGSFSGR